MAGLLHLPHMHYSQLQACIPGSRGAAEYEVYRAHVGEWLSAGKGGQYVVIRGGQIIGFWPTFAAGREAAADQFPGEDSFVYEVREWHPILRTL